MMGTQQTTGIDPALAEVIEGLSAPHKHLPAKLFYDAVGSDLFVGITQQPEYYLTRSEVDLLQRHAPAIAERIGPNTALLELGSGSSIKTRLLLDALIDPAAFVPVDISRAALDAVLGPLGIAYPELRIEPVCADFSRPFPLPSLAPSVSWSVFYPGSTIGNLHPQSAARFLTRLRLMLSSGDGFLIGADLQKDQSVLHAAYNDAAGVTAAFNKNILTHINRRFGADFDTDAFAHKALYNAAAGRIEMHLISKRPQVVHLGGRAITFNEGEGIHTESSYKYSIAGFKQLLSEAGLELTDMWTDSNEYFATFWAVIP